MMISNQSIERELNFEIEIPRDAYIEIVHNSHDHIAESWLYTPLTSVCSYEI